MRRGITSWRRLLVAVALAAAISIPSQARAVVGSNSGTPAGNIFNGAYVNDLIGAGTFYGLGFGGGRAVVANVEAGAIWNGHETLTGRVSQYVKDPAILGTQLGQFDWHATMVGQTIGGTGLYTYQEGIAPAAQLHGQHRRRPGLWIQQHLGGGPHRGHAHAAVFHRRRFLEPRPERLLQSRHEHDHPQRAAHRRHRRPG
ncbi:MAG: hypothetical protein EBR23_04700 [Planctomycetia bacterium]|nr:hypothetical protein [Planctomycetia bacterium]